MSVTELVHCVHALSTTGASAELNRRMLLPSTVLILFFFALPLSLARRGSGKAGCLIAGIVLLVLIYNVQLLLHRQVGQGAFPGWTMWAAQIAMLAGGVFLWKRVEADRLPRVLSLAGEWAYLMHQAFMHRVAHRWSSGGER